MDRVRAGTLHGLCLEMLLRHEVIDRTGRVARPLLDFEERSAPSAVSSAPSSPTSGAQATPPPVVDGGALPSFDQLRVISRSCHVRRQKSRWATARISWGACAVSVGAAEISMAAPVPSTGAAPIAMARASALDGRRCHRSSRACHFRRGGPSWCRDDGSFAGSLCERIGTTRDFDPQRCHRVGGPCRLDGRRCELLGRRCHGRLRPLPLRWQPLRARWDALPSRSQPLAKVSRTTPSRWRRDKRRKAAVPTRGNDRPSNSRTTLTTSRGTPSRCSSRSPPTW